MIKFNKKNSFKDEEGKTIAVKKSKIRPKLKLPLVD
jgi:hypothetical protein